VFAIPKASQISHVEENALAAQIVLSDEEIEQIEQAFPLGRRRKGIPTL
jgi:diketogulonate reductase-like aldo/keto reductase